METIESELFACVRLPGVLSGSRQQTKQDPKCKKSKFIGYDEESKAYLLKDLETRRVLRARSVTFNENIILDDFMVDSEPLQTVELSIEGCIDLSNQARRKPEKRKARQMRVILQIHWGLLRKIWSRRKQ